MNPCQKDSHWLHYVVQAMDDSTYVILPVIRTLQWSRIGQNDNFVPGVIPPSSPTITSTSSLASSAQAQASVAIRRRRQRPPSLTAFPPGASPGARPRRGNAEDAVFVPRSPPVVLVPSPLVLCRRQHRHRPRPLCERGGRRRRSARA